MAYTMDDVKKDAAQVFASNPHIDKDDGVEVLMVVASMMSDAQEQMARGQTDRANHVINVAKCILFDFRRTLRK